MAKKLITFLLVLLIGCCSFAIPAYATNEEILPPEVPIVDETDIDGSNELIEQYNSEVDTYNEYVEEHNAQVDATYEEEKAIVDANNTFVEHVQDEIAEDTPEARGFENYTADGADAPTDWEDTTTEEELKTISIEKSDTPSGETTKVINIHVYLDESSPEAPYSFDNFIDTDEFELSEEMKERAVLIEWETAEFDLNDTVTMSGENAVFAGNIVYLNGARKWMGANPNFYFFREIEGYTQGLWHQSEDMVASNATVQETGYDGAGTTHTVAFEEQQKAVSYLYNGVKQTEYVPSRTTNLYESIKPVFSIFTYMFYRMADEPVVMEEPIKGEYLDSLDKMDLLVAPEVEPEPIVEEPEIVDNPTVTPIPPVVVETEEPKPVITVNNVVSSVPLAAPARTTIEKTPIVKLENDEVPMAPSVIKHWSLVNLILLICTVFTLLRFNKEKKYNIINYLTPVVALGLFIWTQNVHNPWIWVDKWTIWMAINYVIAVIFRIKWFNKKEDEIDLEK